jgi:hypothetical protein
VRRFGILIALVLPLLICRLPLRDAWIAAILAAVADREVLAGHGDALRQAIQMIG